MGIFSNRNNNGVEVSQRQLLQNKYASSCNNILLVVALTVINIILLVTNSNTYFLFSAYIPFALADIGMYLCGMYPAEVYGGDSSGMMFLSKNFFAIALGIAAVILILYVLSWVFSKKQKSGWLIFALVFFAIDTLAMVVLNGFAMESIIDYVIHAWVIISFVNGLVCFYKLKKLPKESQTEELYQEPNFEAADTLACEQSEN